MMLTSLQLCSCIIKIVASPQRHTIFHEYVKAKYGDETNDRGTLLWHLMVVRDVKTRWNSVLAMLERALLLKKVSLSCSNVKHD
jgi:hypothetical protein